MYSIERIIERIMIGSPQHSVVDTLQYILILRYRISRVGLYRQRYKVMGVKDCLKAC